MGYIEALVQEYEELKGRVHNLNLYLSYVEKVDPALFGAMQDEFDGMAGYASDVQWGLEK